MKLVCLGCFGVHAKGDTEAHQNNLKARFVEVGKEIRLTKSRLAYLESNQASLLRALAQPAPSPPKREEYLLPVEAADYLRLKTHHIYRLIKAGLLPAKSYGKLKRIKLSDLESLDTTGIEMPKPYIKASAQKKKQAKRATKKKQS